MLGRDACVDGHTRVATGTHRLIARVTGWEGWGSKRAPAFFHGRGPMLWALPQHTRRGAVKSPVCARDARPDCLVGRQAWGLLTHRVFFLSPYLPGPGLPVPQPKTPC